MDEAVTARIIYDDDEIRVIWQPGSADFVLVTFGDVVTPALDLRFFADTPTHKAGIPALGIMSKQGLWYPKAHILAAQAAIMDAIGPYQTRVFYGGSMGGYGALKFSALLGATHVIALCPQWSMDEAECEGANPGFREFFRESLRGIGIRPAEIAGAVFVFSDPFEAVDAFHVRMIMRAYPATHFIRFPMAGHHVTPLMAGTDNMLQLIAACLAADLPTLRAMVRRVRIAHWLRAHHVARAAIRRFGDTGLRLLIAHVPVDPQYMRWNADHIWAALDYLVRHGEPGQAVAFYEKLYHLLEDPVRQLQACAYLSRIAGVQISLQTWYGSRLVYDLARNRCIHSPVPPNGTQFYVSAAFFGQHAALFVDCNGVRFHLTVDASSAVTVATGAHSSRDLFPFRVEAGGQGRFALRHAGTYLCAEPAEVLICNREAAHDLEKFRFACVAPPM